MRICFLGYSLDVVASGAAQHVHALGNELQARGHEVVIATRLVAGGRSTRESLPLLPLGSGPVGGVSAIGEYVLQALWELRTNRRGFNLIHSVGTSDTLVALAAAVRASSGTPVVHTALVRPRYRLFYKGISGLIVTSNLASPIGGAHTWTMLPCVEGPFFDIDRPAAGAMGPPTVGFLGPPEPRKGIRVFAEVMAGIHRADPSVSFRLALGSHTDQVPHLRKERE